MPVQPKRSISTVPPCPPKGCGIFFLRARRLQALAWRRPGSKPRRRAGTPGAAMTLRCGSSALPRRSCGERPEPSIGPRGERARPRGHVSSLGIIYGGTQHRLTSWASVVLLQGRHVLQLRRAADSLGERPRPRRRVKDRTDRGVHGGAADQRRPCPGVRRRDRPRPRPNSAGQRRRVRRPWSSVAQPREGSLAVLRLLGLDRRLHVGLPLRAVLRLPHTARGHRRPAGAPSDRSRDADGGIRWNRVVPNCKSDRGGAELAGNDAGVRGHHSRCRRAAVPARCGRFAAHRHGHRRGCQTKAIGDSAPGKEVFECLPGRPSTDILVRATFILLHSSSLHHHFASSFIHVVRCLACAYSCLQGSHSMLITHFLPMLAEMGVSPARAVLLVWSA